MRIILSEKEKKISRKILCQLDGLTVDEASHALSHACGVLGVYADDIKKTVVFRPEYVKNLSASFRGENIKANLTHDAGAYGRCTCGRYSDNPEILTHNFQCECGNKAGWSGSFKKPDRLSNWSDA